MKIVKDNVNKIFDKQFFDVGKKELGVYESYQWEDLYSQFGFLATWVKNHFNPKRVLDVGCAKGFLVKAFKDLGIEAWGVDVSDYAISSAPDDVRSTLYKVDLNKDILPFKDEYFDFVTFLGTIEYLNDHEHCLHEINRVLTMQGGLYLTTIYKKDPRDKVRVNIHDKGYWVEEFQSSGFRFVPQKLDSYRRERLTHTITASQRNTLRFKFGKLLYQTGGYIGKEIVFLVSKLTSSRDYGILLFVKEDK